ncbi:MAG TPA: sodium-dependent bicarbonate transport family permease, partial [Pirellulales bacterium]
MDFQHHLHEFWQNFTHNLFKPLLLFFYMGFLVPILGVAFEFPYVLYQGLTIFLLISIGWEGGEKLAGLSPDALNQALGFMLIGFVLNFLLGVIAYGVLRACTRLRRVDAATVAAYYGSDSAGTFATCLGVLGGLQLVTLVTALTAGGIQQNQLGLGKNIKLEAVTTALADDAIRSQWEQSGIDVQTVEKAAADASQYVPAAYMPVMLAIMEIPGCLVGLFLVSRMRQAGMDRLGNMPDEPGYDPHARPDTSAVGATHGAHAKA